MNDARAIAESLDRLAVRCREGGFPLTVQRRAVFETLLARSDHPTADSVFDDVRRRVPEIGRTTVYRTLDRLVELGFAIRVHRLGLAARFDSNVGPHDHLVCVGCGSMEDLEPLPDEGDARAAPIARRGFTVVGRTTQVHVLCPACRPSDRAGPSSASPTAQSTARTPEGNPS